MDHRPAWAARRQWRVLQGGWNAGAEFLLAWAHWRDDPQRPALLHYVAIDAAPRETERWSGLTPGFHRFSYEGGRVLLTLCVGERAAMLREQAFRADAILLDELTPTTLKALPRLCRRGTVLSCAGKVDLTLDELAGLGFVADDGFTARYAPSWKVKGLPDAERDPPLDAIVIGAGLAGAAVASSLARRGCTVQVLDAGAEPAGGASALPAGLVAPHQSPDDNLLSRLSRCGVRISVQECAQLLRAGTDWSLTGVLEHRGGDQRALPALGAALAPGRAKRRRRNEPPSMGPPVACHGRLGAAFSPGPGLAGDTGHPLSRCLPSAGGGARWRRLAGARRGRGTGARAGRRHCRGRRHARLAGGSRRGPSRARPVSGRSAGRRTRCPRRPSMATGTSFPTCRCRKDAHG
ncbi:FAD-dependent oxidoreductase [Ramlibacter terrae]|uniref:FAD-dependent oxidoreductase n=1 Tax=Ramlibacter terrae TaxID=2732511 RepID=A0ABX6P2Q1_9BURK|nr:FAD-dependent oxidoreductase [Ramlibacter terrae]